MMVQFYDLIFQNDRTPLFLLLMTTTMTTEEKAENPLDDGDEEVISVVPRPCRTSTTSIFWSDIGDLVHDVIERYI